ncbi:hypothetical protein ACB092_09G184900 [Castanea dentata]
MADSGVAAALPQEIALKLLLLVGIEELLNALEAACFSDWKSFWTQPHNVLNASEVC